MKLLTKTTIYFLLAMIPLLAIGGYYLSETFNSELREETDEEILNDRHIWVKRLQQTPKPEMLLQLNLPEFMIRQADTALAGPEVLSDIAIYSETEKKNVPYRQLRQVVKTHDHNYEITIRKSLLEKNDYIRSVSGLLLIVFSGLLIFALLFNWVISRKLWKPFYLTLQNLKEWELRKMGAIEFPVSSVAEFNELNGALHSMARRIDQDYNVMKEFTEDSAHEMQTPLAIAMGKLEILLQDESLTNSQLGFISQAEEALLRLNRLNASLLLIAKIDNGQFISANKIVFSFIVDKYLLQFKEFITNKKLVIKKNVNGEFIGEMHLSLAESMISNLLGNAVKYNNPFGEVTIKIDDRSCSIENTSSLPAIEKDGLFRRFKRSEATGDSSNGLGLAIVNKIAEKNNLKIMYNYNGTHKFTIERDN